MRILGRAARVLAGLVVTGTAVLSLVFAPAAAAATTWSSETSPTTNALLGVNCPDANNCWAVGGTSTASTIVHTANASTASPTWSTQTSPTGATDQYNNVSCASSTNCVAVGGLVSSKPLI